MKKKILNFFKLVEKQVRKLIFEIYCIYYGGWKDSPGSFSVIIRKLVVIDTNEVLITEIPGENLIDSYLASHKCTQMMKIITGEARKA